VQWMHRYERIGRYNRWGDHALRDHVEMSLSGAALKWFTCKDAAGQLANEWQDQAGPPAIPEMKTQILGQFRPVNQDDYNEEKLRARKQGAEETTREFYYDVLDLCRRVNPRMVEAEKLKCLWRGLKPSVIEKLWSLKPTTCDGFLEEVKRLEELTSWSDVWNLGVLGETTPPAKDERMDRLERMMEDLLGAVAAKKPENPPQQGWKTGDAQRGPPWQGQGRRPVNLRWTPDGRPVCGKCETEGHIMRDCPRSNRKQQMDFGRTPDGQFVCYGCGGAVHIQRFCPGGQQRGGQQPGPPPQQRKSGAGQQLIGLIGTEDRNTEEKVWPVLKIDFKRLVVQDVLCGGRRIPAVIDTGATVSVCSQKLVEELKLTVRPWRANDLVSVDGKEICPRSGPIGDFGRRDQS
jgi:hypothetical protein